MRQTLTILPLLLLAGGACAEESYSAKSLFFLISNEPQPTEYSVGYAAHSWRLRRSGAYVAC